MKDSEIPYSKVNKTTSSIMYIHEKIIKLLNLLEREVVGT
jgi:hypothetical protein